MKDWFYKRTYNYFLFGGKDFLDLNPDLKEKVEKFQVKAGWLRMTIGFGPILALIVYLLYEYLTEKLEKDVEFRNLYADTRIMDVPVSYMAAYLFYPKFRELLEYGYAFDNAYKLLHDETTEYRIEKACKLLVPLLDVPEFRKLIVEYQIAEYLLLHVTDFPKMFINIEGVMESRDVSMMEAIIENRSLYNQVFTFEGSAEFFYKLYKDDEELLLKVLNHPNLGGMLLNLSKRNIATTVTLVSLLSSTEEGKLALLEDDVPINDILLNITKADRRIPNCILHDIDKNLILGQCRESKQYFDGAFDPVQYHKIRYLGYFGLYAVAFCSYIRRANSIGLWKHSPFATFGYSAIRSFETTIMVITSYFLSRKTKDISEYFEQKNYNPTFSFLAPYYMHGTIIGFYLSRHKYFLEPLVAFFLLASAVSMITRT